jgi:hypothetical protein
MSDANAISDLERAEHLGYADGKGVKRVSIFNDGVQINAATEENQDKTASYSISDIDESGTTKYYGYLNENGKWYIMEVTGTTVRYASGISLFSTNWANRIALTYGTFDNVF